MSRAADSLSVRFLCLLNTSMQARIIDRQRKVRYRGPNNMPNVTVCINQMTPLKNSLLAEIDVKLEVVVAVF